MRARELIIIIGVGGFVRVGASTMWAIASAVVDGVIAMVVISLVGLD